MDRTLDHGNSRSWDYDTGEILADGVIHGVGLVLALAGTIVLLGMLLARGQVTGLLSHGIYCATLLITLAASAAYNMWPVSPIKWRLRRLDHAMIFGLIAGTYTPFLIRIGHPETNVLLAAIWVVSVLGMGLKLADLGRRERLSTLLYLLLGWSGLLAIRTLSVSLPSLSLGLIVVGGGLYSVGSIFHLWRALRFQNAIWHGFVLAGATCHFAAVATAVTA